MKRSYLLILILLSMSVGSYESQIFSRKTVSSVIETENAQGHVRTIINSTFSFGRINEAKDSYEVLLSKKIETTSIPGLDGHNSKIDVVAWVTKNELYDTVLWSIKDTADEGSKWGHFYRTVKYGHFDSETVHRYFDFKTGNYAFSCTTKPVFVYIHMPNTFLRRNISYISAMATSDEYKHRDNYPNGIGMLTIGSNDSSVDQLIIEYKVINSYILRSPKILIIDPSTKKEKSSLTILHSNKKPITESVTVFSVKLTYHGGLVIIIPVKNGKFDIDNAQLPESVSIRRL